MTTLEGATALVTGASRGIGHAVARALARRGARVCLVARDAEALRSVARELAGLAPPLLILPTDLVSDTGIDALVREASSRSSTASTCSSTRRVSFPTALRRRYRSGSWTASTARTCAPVVLTQGLLPAQARVGEVVFINSTSDGKPRERRPIRCHQARAPALAESLRPEGNAAGVRAPQRVPGAHGHAAAGGAIPDRGSAPRSEAPAPARGDRRYRPGRDHLARTGRSPTSGSGRCSSRTDLVRARSAGGSRRGS